MSRKAKTQGWIWWSVVLAATLTGCSILVVLPWRWIDPPTSAFMLRYRMEHGRAPKQAWVDLEDISRSMSRAVVASEDQKFFEHYGFDLESIADAMRERRRARGASTITQQTVKNLYLWQGRSWVRKGLEAYLTVLAECLWPKRRIVEIYLNVAEFGPGVYGVKAASKASFGKGPKSLTQYESALLAAVLPSPRRMSARSPSNYVRGRAQEILDEMRRMGPLPR